MSDRGVSLLALTLLFGCSTGEQEVEYSEPEELIALPVEDTDDEPGQEPPSYEQVEPVSECAEDLCPAEHGVEWRCQKRFVYGTNLAWDEFAGDFGGIERWGVTSISEDPTRYSNIMRDAKAHGAGLIRWWMFPDFRGDGVLFDESGQPIGVTQKVLDDVSVALDLAARHDLYLMLTLFSFDGFYPVDGEDPDWPTYLTPIALDPALREALNENVIRPIARTVERHPHAIRLHSWDLMNEPEWAIKGSSLYGDPLFSPITSPDATDPITHEEMETFLAELNTVLRQESSALLSVGGSLKWAQAWTGLDLDFHQLHYYPWMETTYTFDRTPEEIGLTDKPLVLGEFPGNSKYLPDSIYTYEEILTQLRDKGWAGALGWDFGGSTEEDKDALLPFAEEHSCETSY